ncbi:hypothetical protein [Rhizobium sp.]
MTLGIIATVSAILGMLATPLFGALVDASRHKRTLIVVPVVIITTAAPWTLAAPGNLSVFGVQCSVARRQRRSSVPPS